MYWTQQLHQNGAKSGDHNWKQCRETCFNKCTCHAERMYHLYAIGAEVLAKDEVSMQHIRG